MAVNRLIMILTSLLVSCDTLRLLCHYEKLIVVVAYHICQNIVKAPFVHFYISLLAGWHIPKKYLTLGSRLGGGEFGG